MTVRGALRQSQIIAPFGPGSMHMDRFGVSLICCGLDHWFGESPQHDIEEFKIDDEWRIQRDLHVNHLRRPPDYRRSQAGMDVPNSGMIIPFLRFPTWHYCTVCGKMEKTSLSYQGTGRKKNCPSCEKNKSVRNPLVQVRFVAVCEDGHIMEFPWKEWAHQSLHPTCSDDALRLVEYGGGTLESIEISCTECGKRRRLHGITSNELVIGKEKLICKGQRLWLHDEQGVGCEKSIRGSLRNASNIYFARIFSSIFLPKHPDQTASEHNPVTAEILELFERPVMTAVLDLLFQLFSDADEIVEKLRANNGQYFKEYSDDEISSAIGKYKQFNGAGKKDEESIKPEGPIDRKAFRLEEYRILTQGWDESYLMSKLADLKNYSSRIKTIF